MSDRSVFKSTTARTHNISSKMAAAKFCSHCGWAFVHVTNCFYDYDYYNIIKCRAWINHMPLYSVCGSVAEWLECWTCNQQLAGSKPGLPAIEWNPGQVVNTYVPLSPSSITWSQLQSNRRSDIALAMRQTLVVLHLRAQGLGEGDEHPPILS